MSEFEDSIEVTGRTMGSSGAGNILTKCIDELRKGLCAEPQIEHALYVAATSRGSHYARSDIVPGWDPDLRELFDKLAAKSPQLLQKHAKLFTHPATEQLEFALALNDQGPWPVNAMPAVARQFLNSPAETFAYENRIPAETLREAATRLLRSESVPVLQWARIEFLLTGADDEFKELALTNYCGQDFRSKAFRLASAGSSTFAARLLNVAIERQLSFAGAISASLVLTEAFAESWGAQVPAKIRQALLWDLRCGNDVEADVSLMAYSHLNTQVAGDLLRECLAESRAIALIPAIQDDRVVSELLDRIAAGAEPSAVMIDALVACGTRAERALLAACSRKKLPTGVGIVAAEVLGRLATNELQTLVELLAHPSKRVVAAAAKSLSLRNEAARDALKVGSHASKKSIRTQCERLLAKLSEKQTDVTTPLRAVRERTRQMPEAEREAFSKLWNATGSSEASWQAELKPVVRHLGALALELLRDWFVERLEDGETRLWCYAVEELRADPEAVWVAVDTFARMPKLGASLWARPRRALSHCGPLLGPPIVHILHQVHTEYREALFGLLASYAPDIAQGVFLTGLSDPSKSVRTHSVDGLSRTQDGPLSEVAELLGAGDIGTRVAAAELLAVWGRSDAAAQVVRAWANERSKWVRPYLEDTLVACGRADLVFALEAGAPLDIAAAERDLLQQTLPENLPRFIRLRDLPPLRFRDGSTGPKNLRVGFLARLMKLDLTLKGRAVRCLLPLFQLEDIREWSRYLYKGWSLTRSPKHKWAILQLSLLADDELLNAALSQLADWKGTEHAAVTCHLRAAQWHGSETSMQWLGYWSENLASFGGRLTARQLFNRVAFKRNCTSAELRGQLAPFIGEEYWEQQLQEEAAPGRARLRVLAELKRSWLTGRDWTPAALGKFLGRQDFLGGSQLLWRTTDGKIYRFTSLGRNQVDSLPAGLWAASAPHDGLPDGAQGLFGLDDNPVGETERLRLLHPLDLSSEKLALWRGASPQRAEIPQLERDTYHHSRAGELRGLTSSSERFAQWRRRERWFHGEPMDGGIVYTNSLHLLKRNLIVTLHHTGYGIGAAEFEQEVRVLGVAFSDLDGSAVAAEELPAIVYSELHRSIRRLGEAEQ